MNVLQYVIFLEVRAVKVTCPLPLQLYLHVNSTLVIFFFRVNKIKCFLAVNELLGIVLAIVIVIPCPLQL